MTPPPMSTAAREAINVVSMTGEPGAGVVRIGGVCSDVWSESCAHDRKPPESLLRRCAARAVRLAPARYVRAVPVAVIGSRPYQPVSSAIAFTPTVWSRLGLELEW